MVGFVVLFSVIAFLGLVALIAGLIWDDGGLAVLGIPVLALGIVMAVAAGNAEEPDCSKVYNPDGSYVETCEYPGDE